MKFKGGKAEWQTATILSCGKKAGKYAQQVQSIGAGQKGAAPRGMDQALPRDRTAGQYQPRSLFNLLPTF